MTNDGERHLSPEEPKTTTIKSSVTVNHAAPGSAIYGTYIERLSGDLIIQKIDSEVVQRGDKKRILVTRVRDTWIDGNRSPLVQSESINKRFLGETKLLGMTYRERTDLVQIDTPKTPHHFPLSERKQETPIPFGMPLWNLFVESTYSLLLLSQAGGGKTTQLLELARLALIEHEKMTIDDAVVKRVPIVLELSTWRKSTKDVETWIIEQVSADKYYNMEESDCRAWIENNELILLLDGLDRVKDDIREQCVEALNQFIGQRGTTHIAITCRSEIYSQLKTPLILRRIVEIEPLTLAQIKAFFDAAGGKVKNLWQLVNEDKLLLEMLQAPVLLHIMSLTFADEDQTPVFESDQQSIEQRRYSLFERFVDRQLSNHRDDIIWEIVDIQKWLSWLAQQKRDHSIESIFIEQIQPSWLPNLQTQRLYILLSRVFVFLEGGLLGGFLIGFALAIIGDATGFVRRFVEGVLGGTVTAFLVAAIEWNWKMRFRFFPLIQSQSARYQSVIKAAIILAASIVTVAVSFGVMLGGGRWLAFGVMWWMAEGARVGIVFGCVASLLFAFGPRNSEDGLTRDILTAGSLNWSFQEAISGALIAGLFGVAIGIGLSFLDPNNPTVYLVRRTFRSPLLSVIAPAGVISGICALVGLFFGGLRGAVSREQSLSPNYGLRRALFNTGIMAPFIALVFGFVALALGWFFVSQEFPFMLFFVPYAFFISLVAAHIYGGLFLLQHLALRFILQRLGLTPRFGQFANMLLFASDRLLLTRVGGGFKFFHKYLEEYFADSGFRS